MANFIVERHDISYVIIEGVESAQEALEQANIRINDWQTVIGEIEVINEEDLQKEVY